MKKIFLDTNIFIDIIADRDLDNISISKLSPYLEKSKIYMSALSIHITYYSLKIKSNSREHEEIKNFLNILNIVPLTDKIIDKSINTFSKDFEDTLQYYSALDSDCNYILTRDIKDFIKIKKDIPSNIQILDTLEKII